MGRPPLPLNDRRGGPAPARAARPAAALVLAGAVALLGGGCPGRRDAARQDPVLPPVQIRGTWYRVRAGDTLAALARRYGVPLSDIAEINDLDRSDALPAGRQVFIPRARPVAHEVRPPGREGDGGGAGGAGEGATPGQGTAAGGGGEAGPKSGGDAAPVPKLQWPLPGGNLVSRFGRRGKRPHEGIDIAAGEGKAVLAAADGVVIYAGSGVTGYGNLVVVRHAGGLVTVYAHNSRNLVSEGTRVRAGDVIAEVGHSGRATGNHLHFEVRRGEEPQDPLKYVHP